MLATIIISLVILCVFVAIVVRGVQNRKQGKSSCSCGCGNCPGKTLCHPERDSAS